MTIIWFPALVTGIFAVDMALTVWILLHNGKKVNPLMGTPIRWWGPEGVAFTKIFVYMLIMYFHEDISSLLRIAIVVIWILVCVWNVRQIHHMKWVEQVNKQIDRFVGRVRKK